MQLSIQPSPAFIHSPLTSMILLFDHMTENTLFYIYCFMYRYLRVFCTFDQFSLCIKQIDLCTVTDFSRIENFPACQQTYKKIC
jgi:hypothetical protein